MRRLAIHGQELAVRIEGAGAPLLLVHGFPFDHSMWASQIECFASTRLVIAPDLPGFGASEPIEGVYTMARFADDLAELLDALAVQEPVIFCGLSMGGYIAWEFWRRHRQRLAGLVLCDTRAAADDEQGVQNRKKKAEAVLQHGSKVLAMSMTSQLFSQRTAQHQVELIEQTHRVSLLTAPSSVAAALLGMAERFDMTSRLGDITLPALAICGEEDAISPPAEMAEMAQAMPDARYVQIEGAGHLAPLENPSAVNAAMEEFMQA